ncbi:dermonecrotic toxin domain-containing protein [Pseudomonas fluorescens]|uniref:Dermonecrotic toxin N-terminal domain-containing protein n=1 Tax=Pseudomonas fluorescens TaxID=294 RepID=A0A5E7AYZ9_PSEFL|nr:DUF6543 domain-containing protein [Pseudomonas fluorescens]VVN84109.1 hypothetical protein PS710_01346 [Pseudomonas fluorescens]
MTCPRRSRLSFPPFSPLLHLPDESLFSQASANWRESSQGLRELVAASPGIRDTLDQLLKQSLDLDGQRAGLLFTGTDEQPESFISFTQAFAFVLQHPTLETTLDQRCQVTGLDQAHPLSSLTPLHMLERLKTLHAEQSHNERWQTFWAQRAPGTALSRQERVIQLYRNHFEAAAQLAVARKALTEEQLKLLQLLIDPPVAALTLNEQPIHTEQVALVLSNRARIKLTGAWVITTGEAASGWQLLYLPSKPVAIQAFNQRSDMQDWLSSQALVPTGLPTDNMRFEYTANTDPLVVGASDLFAAHLQAQVTALRHGTRGKSGLAAHGAQSLAQAEQVDRQRNQITFFASPPGLETADDNPETDETSLFGNLYADIPWSLRQATLKQQRDALEALVEEVGEGEGLQPFKDSLKTLETAEQAADKAASSLLNRSRTLDLVTFQQEFTALHSAHKTALHAEAAVQLALKQLDDDECDLLKALLDTPDDPGPDWVAASLTLLMTELQDDTATVTAQVFKGAIILTRVQVLADADSPHSVLLYWLGTGGGLQRFANRRELERQVFKVHDRNDGLTVLLKKVTGDALLHGLNQLTSDFEEQAGAIRQRHATSAESVQQAEQLDILRIKALATLQVPVHAARNLAVAHLLEQDQSATLASRLPDWLGKLEVADRTSLKGLIEAYIAAMKRSHELITVALEPRDDFTRKHLHARLREDFSIKGSFEVKLDMPDSTRWEKQYFPAPGQSGYKLVLIPSAERSKMPLEELAQLNIDNTPSMNLEPLSLQLSFMRVEVTTADASERQTLTNGITRDYLKRVLPELDLPKAYEQLIRDTFMGATTEPVFVREHRRESLIEPWALMLKLQGEFSRVQQQIGHNDLQVLKIAIAADTAQAWNADGKRIVLLPAYLSPGGKDTPNEGPVTLSGVTFIEEQVSGVTLLYLPDSPDGQFLRRYDSLEAARKALFNLCVHDKWVTYLAGRALQGNVPAHESRIKQAMLKHFDSVIGVGVSWPATTSLAAHLLNAHMGRLIEAHRGTSRSNDALYMERYALQGPRAFNYIKMALGMLPFIGSVFALYDAWTSANQAVSAFLRGAVGDGLAEVESVLLSLIDAAMDLLPGEAAFSVGSSAARSLTRARQLHRLVRKVAAMHGISQRQARHVLARFVGYEYDKPISLAGLLPATHGLYRGIYRHADGDFIVRQGRIFKVELSKDSRSWRLFGNAQKTYKQPIALDETGHWDTWYGVYGTTFDGGGLGGGQVLGHLADAFDPVWPQVIRQRLPRWWADQRFRRQQQLTEIADDLSSQLNARIKNNNETINKYHAATAQNRPTLMPAAEAVCISDIETAIRRYEALVELEPLTQARKQRSVIEMQSSSAWLIADRYRQRAIHASHNSIPLTQRIGALNAQLDALPSDALSQRLSLLEEIRKLRVELVRKLDQMEGFKRDVNYWFDRIRIKKDKDHIKRDVEDLNARLSDANVTYLRTANYLEIVKRYARTSDTSWLYLQGQTRQLRAKVDRALYTQDSLPEVSVSQEQRNQILQDCITLYTQFRREMRIWTTSYPQHFHQEAVEPLLSGIEKMTEWARKGIDQPAPAAPVGKIEKKVFPTEDNQWLIGIEKWDTKKTKRHFEVNEGEVWEPNSDGKFRRLNPSIETPAPARMDLATLVDEAQKRLDFQPTYQSRVEAYADQDMLPVDLEHMMVSEAGELIRRADRIQAIDAQNPLIKPLRDKAGALTTIGREMRTRQSLTTKKPTDGMLEDLLDQQAVDIRKPSQLKNLGKRKDGRNDYMQEYEIWDLTLEPAELLWYAHFHYSSAKPVLRQFEKAHLKLPAHRFLTHADNADLPYADIGKRSGVVAHFEGL